MAILFYDHLVLRTPIDEHLDSLSEADNQKGKARQLIDDIIFQGIVSHILSKLHPHHHQTFLTTLHERPYDPEIIEYLKTHAGPNIEEEIRLEADKIVQMILKDLQSAD